MSTPTRCAKCGWPKSRHNMPAEHCDFDAAIPASRVKDLLERLQANSAILSEKAWRVVRYELEALLGDEGVEP